MKKQITVTFSDERDAQNFEKYASLAKSTDGTVTGVYCGVMCSALKRAELSVTTNAPDYGTSVERAIGDICFSASLELDRAARALLGKLTAEEIHKFTQDGQFPMRLAKCLLVASDKTIAWQFSAEATLKEIKALRRIDKNRTY